LKLILGVRHSLNWIILFPDSFLDTIQELDDETKKLILFHFKMEIEEYYKENYLVEELKIMEFHNEYARRERKGRKIIDIPGVISIIPPIIGEREDYSKLIAIPGKEWHLMRFNNISDYSTVTIPGFCIRCNTEGASFMILGDTWIVSFLSIFDTTRVAIHTENATNVIMTLAFLLMSCCFPILLRYGNQDLSLEPPS